MNDHSFLREGVRHTRRNKTALALSLFLPIALFGAQSTSAVPFEKNDGPDAGRFPYEAHLNSRNALLSASGFSIQLSGGPGPGVVVAGIEFAGAKSTAVGATNRLPGHFNSFSGANPAAWRCDIAAFASIRFHGLYPGIDLLYRGHPSGLEYDFVLSPGANYHKIWLRPVGSASLRVQDDGTLLLASAAGKITQAKPDAYQEWNGVRHVVEVSYQQRGDGVGFRVGRYDRHRRLVIDPVVVVYTGLFGGYLADEGTSIATDAVGAAYVTGITSSYDFPVTPGAANTQYVPSSFVTKLTAKRDGIIYSTFLAGRAHGIAVDSTGSAYVVASTFIGSHVAPADGIQVTRLTPAGDAIVYQTSLPGPGTARAITVDSQGNAYITGSTSASNFPITAGVLQTRLLGTDAYVVKLDPAGHLVYATFLGGSGFEEGRGITVDASQNVYVTGVTSESMDFPVINAAQPSPGGGFVYRSDDGGATWTPAGKGISSAVEILLADPFNASIAYAAMHTGGLARTIDGGASWSPIGRGLGSAGLTSLAMDPANPVTLYAADGSTLYRSSDSGANFSDIGAAIPAAQGWRGPTLVAVDPSQSAVIYAVGNRIAKSTDTGRTWQILPSSFDYVLKFAVDPTHPSTVYLSGMPGGFQKSVDGGFTWKPVSIQGSFALTPAGTLFVVGGQSTLRSDDGGASWKVVGEILPSFSFQLGADPFNSGVIYSWASGGYWAGGSFIPGELYKLAGDSTRWRLLSSTLSGESASTTNNLNYVNALAVSPAVPNRLYFANSPGRDAFVAKINPTATKLIYSTYLGGISNEYGEAIAIDSSGNAYITGSTSSANFPATAGSIQPAFAGGGAFRDPRASLDGVIVDYARGADAFVAKLDSTGSHLVYATYLGSPNPDWGLSIAVDGAGRAFVTGYTQPTAFPTVNDGFPPPKYTDYSAFLSQISPDGSQLLYSTFFGATGGQVASGIALDSQGNAFLTGLGSRSQHVTPGAGSTGTILFTEVQFPTSAAPAISAGGIVDVFTYYERNISPGSLISIFGTGFADAKLRATSTPWPNQLGGLSVTIDGIAAPLYYVSESQINLQVPWEVKPGTSRAIVTTAQGSSAPAVFNVRTASPAIAWDSQNGNLLAVNQDFSLNGETNPAPAGSVLTLYLIGQGPVTNTPPTGWPAASSPLSWVSAPSTVAVVDNFPYGLQVPGELLFFGLAPELVGVGQANVLLPNVPKGIYSLVLRTGDTQSNIGFIYIGPAK